MNFKPTEDRILVKEVEQVNLSLGGIHLPDSRKKTLEVMHGRVVAVGPGRAIDEATADTHCYEENALKVEPVRQAMTIKEGDLVVFPAQVGVPMKVCGEEYFLLGEIQVFGILSE